MNIDNVNTLQRYKAIACSSQTGGCLEENLNGNAVLYEDVVRLVNNHPSKKKFKEPSSILMIDIETFSTQIDAQIAEVALVHTFNRESNTTDKATTFHAYVDSNSKLDRFSVDKATVDFHLLNKTGVLTENSKALSNNTAVPIDDLFKEINRLTCGLPSDTIIYSFGLNFDVPILNYAALQGEDKLLLPSYRNLRCLRTELATATSLGFRYEKKPTAHNALEDCLQQCELLFSIFDFYKRITNGADN